MGRHGGPHDGRTLVEQALDAAVRERPGQMIVQSCGNYFTSSTHVEGRLLQGSEARIPFSVEPVSDAREVEIWYSGCDRLAIGIVGPDDIRVMATPGADESVTRHGEVIARVAHRLGDPNNGRNQAVVWLGKAAPAGGWTIVLDAVDVVDGRYHAWIEREPGGTAAQSQFDPQTSDPRTTTGSICNGLQTITVGAYDAHSPDREVADFSSCGPTVDGRDKPDLLAPGRDVLVARSRPAVPDRAASLYARMSGTSMAAPYVTGTIACMLEQLGPVPAAVIRQHLLTNCASYEGASTQRAGAGYLDIGAVLGSLATSVQPLPTRSDGTPVTPPNTRYAALNDGRVRVGVEAESVLPVLRSARLAGDDTLAAVVAGRLRLGAAGTAPIPAPVVSSGPAVLKVQQALIDVGIPLHQFGADGTFGSETGTAVATFKTAKNIYPNDPVVGRATITALDAELLARQARKLPAPPPASFGPADWFLTGPQIEQYRTPAYTTRNEAVAMREGDRYFEMLLKELENTEAGMRVLMAGWRFTPGLRLAPLASKQTITDMLRGAAKRGATVRVLAYGSAFSTKLPISVPGLPSLDNLQFAAALRVSGIEAVLDSRLAPSFGAQHQKVTVIARPNADASVAYVGGIDLCVDRYDKPQHVFLPERQIEPPPRIPIKIWPLPLMAPLPVKVNTDGWHDVQMEVRGPAVEQIWQAVAERWNDRAPVAGPGGRPIASADTPRPAATGARMAVQVLRTIPCGRVFQSYPAGEQTVQDAYRKVIRRARHFIYIEDQYFWPSPVTADLADAIRRGVIVIAMVARDYDIPGLSGIHQQMRARTAQAVSAAAPDNFRIFHKERTTNTDAIYVHAKVMIVDDLYMAVGSANLNHRSHSNDTELQLGLYDESLADGVMAGQPHPVGERIRQLRQELWAEHLGMDPKDLIDPIESVRKFWPKQPGSKVGQAVWHQLAKIRPASPATGREELRLVLRLIQASTPAWPGLMGPALAAAGVNLGTLQSSSSTFDLGSVADLIPDVTDFVENRLFNPNLQC
jgi:phosphatidylserine/phosphatidylglycerophosphate/cardiolipin synthase-like enzyme